MNPIAESRNAVFQGQPNIELTNTIKVLNEKLDALDQQYQSAIEVARKIDGIFKQAQPTGGCCGAGMASACDGRPQAQASSQGQGATGFAPEDGVSLVRNIFNIFMQMMANIMQFAMGARSANESGASSAQANAGGRNYFAQ